MPSELRPDDEVTDWQYQWQGPDGAEGWWPAMPFVHAQIYLVTHFPAFLLGILLAWGFGTGLVSRVVPVLACLGVAWLVVSEWVKHVDSSRPIAWHRAVLRSELRSPRPPRPRDAAVVATSAAHLLEQLPAPSPPPVDEQVEEPAEEPEEPVDVPVGEPAGEVAEQAAGGRDERPGRDAWSGILA
jgi:hypothetical protein